MNRHIIIIIDGTDCSAARGTELFYTNAFAIFYGTRQVDPENRTARAVVLYHPGPGNRRAFGKLRNEITGAELEDMVREAYLSLCLNIHDMKTDQIYVFGYSRGAIVAKALVEMVSHSGLLPKDNLHLVDSAYKYYRTNSPYHKRCLLDRTYAAQIAFVGLFDPVQGPKNWTMNIELKRKVRNNVKYAVELLAINERRLTFRPSIWELEDPKPNYRDAVIAQSPPGPDEGNLQQIWMPGTHGDIADPSSKSVFTDIAFLTMVERIAARCDLPINTDYIKAICDRLIARKDDVRISQKFHLFPFERKIPLTATAFTHPICQKVNGRAIYYNKRIIRYRSKTRKNPRAMESLGTYSFDIANIDRTMFGQTRGDIIAAIEKALTQIESEL